MSRTEINLCYVRRISKNCDCETRSCNGNCGSSDIDIELGTDHERSRGRPFYKKKYRIDRVLARAPIARRRRRSWRWLMAAAAAGRRDSLIVSYTHRLLLLLLPTNTS